MNQPALAQALEELNRWRATVESSVLAGLDSVEAEEAAIQRSIAELERQLRALRSMRERQTRQRDVIGQELKARAWQAVLTSLTEDRARLMERAALLQQAMVQARADVLEGVREVPGRAAELDGLVTEAVRLRERLQTPGLPAYSRPGVEARLSQVMARLQPVLEAMEQVPDLELEPAGVGVVLASGPAGGPPQLLLLLLPVPYAACTDWNSRPDDIAARLIWRTTLAIHRMLRRIGATTAPIRLIEVEGNLGIEIWLGDHAVPDDLQEISLEAIQSVQEDAPELVAAALEVYSFWLAPELVDLEEGR